MGTVGTIQQIIDSKSLLQNKNGVPTNRDAVFVFGLRMVYCKVVSLTSIDWMRFSMRVRFGV